MQEDTVLQSLLRVAISALNFFYMKIIPIFEFCFMLPHLILTDPLTLFLGINLIDTHILSPLLCTFRLITKKIADYISSISNGN